MLGTHGPAVREYQFLMENERHMHDSVNLMPIMDRSNEAHFGFHYPTPEHPNGKDCLGLVLPRNSDDEYTTVSLVVLSCTQQHDYNPIGSSMTLNTWLGPQVHWLGNSSSVIYNIRNTDGVTFSSKVADAHTQETIVTVSRPVFSVNVAGTRATSLDVGKLKCFSDYGYPVLSAEAKKYLVNKLSHRVPKDDGVWTVDLATSPPQVSATPVVTPWDVVHHMIHGAHRMYSTRREAGKWLFDCFVWIEQPRLNDAGDRFLFTARAKCPASSTTIILDDVRSIPSIDIGVFTVAWGGTDLRYADGAPMNHFDFVDGGPGGLLLCGNEGMLLTQDRVGHGTLWVSGRMTPSLRSDIYSGHCTISRANKRT